MSTLTGQSIDSSYQGLIKTTDNGAITGTAKAVTDGLGNATNIEISNTATNFVSGTVDFTGSTVSGLPGGSAGLESGTGTDSMQSASSLTTNAAIASGNKTIALGDGAEATSEGNIAIGENADAGGDTAFARVNVAVGRGAVANNEKDVAIGDNAQATGSRSIALGDNTSASAGRAIAIGNSAVCSGFSSMVVGNSSTASAEGSIVLGGFSSNATALNAIAVGKEANATGIESLAIGFQSAASGEDSIAIGTSTDVSGQEAIGIGNNVESPNADDVNIGTNNLSAKTGLPGDVIIGKDNNSSTTNGGQNVLIGQSNTITQNERSNVIGYDNTVSRGSHSILGEQNTSSSNYSIAIVGNSNTSTGEKTFVGGHNSGATATGAVALGDGVTAAKTQTVSVKALETQTNSTPTAGGIIMTDAGGTERRLNIDAGGKLQIDSDSVGGGGADQAEGQNITPALNGSGQVYSIPWILSGYSKGAARAFSGNDMMFVPFYAKPGETIDDFYFRIQTAQAGALMNVALYKSYAATIQTNQKVLMPEYVATIATNVDVSTTGKKSFTGLAQSLPSDAVGGMYWIGFLCDTAGVALTKWSNWVAAERIIYSDIYRGTGLDYNVGSMTIPTGQVNVSGATGSTDLPVDFAWTYEA